jgi:hypothetical protein
MSVSRYNRIYNFSLALIVLFNVLCVADMILTLGIVSKIAVVYMIYTLGMLAYKVHLTRKYFLGNDVIYNLIAHGVLTGTSIVMILIIVL